MTRRSVERDLDAAGITEPRLREDYRHCRALASHHGRTYFLATRFLPPDRRPAVHALYGFARTADDIVDEAPPGTTVAEMTERLHAFGATVDQPGVLDDADADPTVRAAVHTARRYDLDPQLFADFLESMRMDLTITEYETHDDLARYTHGSAAVIGLMMVPILGTVGPAAEARPFAADLGVAFQLTNFIRDVGDDLARGRIYLPLESLRRFGIDRARLERRIVDDDVRALLRFEIDRTRAIYRRAEPGIDLLAPRARGCVRVAYRLYGDILGAVEAADYQVFGPRIRVTRRARAGVAGGMLARSAAAGAARRVSALRGSFPSAGNGRGASGETDETGSARGAPTPTG